MLLEPALVRRLDLLALASRAPVRGGRVGARRAPATGASVEFRDFRTYSPGDDFRRVDWNTYARLERLFLRMYQAEESTCATFLLDCSASMQEGEGQAVKFAAAQRLAAALAYVALQDDDTVAVGGCAEQLTSYLPARGGRHSAGEIWAFLERLAPTARGQTSSDLGASLQDAARRLRRGGLCYVFSDLLTAADWRRGLLALRAAGQETTVIQILAPGELDPPLRGELALVDRETGQRREITVTTATLRAYQQRLAAYTAEIAAYCRGHEISFVQISSALGLEDVLLRVLRRAGVVA
jgi:uncharacterized protein (DUF58 family)